MQRANSISISGRFSVFHRAAALFLTALMVPAGWAQDNSAMPAAPSAQTQSAMPSSSQPFNVKEYSKPRPAFPNLVAPYTPRRTKEPNLANTPRIDQFLRDGKLYISINDAIALALENNLDIAIARYNLNIADTDVWRAKAGASTLGVTVVSCRTRPEAAWADWVGWSVRAKAERRWGREAPARVGGLVGSTLGSGPLNHQL